jgi:hypothetical protein
MTDILPINLPYSSSWRLFEKTLRAIDPDLYQLMMSAFNTQHKELAAYLGMNDSSYIIPLGKQPLDYAKEHRLFETADVKAVPHPVTMLHISNAVDEDRMKESEEVYKLLIGEILGEPVQYSEYFRAWKAKHGEAWISMLARRKATGYGGIFVTQSQVDHRAGGSKMSQSQLDHSYGGSKVTQSQVDHSYGGSKVTQSQLDHRAGGSKMSQSQLNRSYGGSEVSQSQLDHSLGGSKMSDKQRETLFPNVSQAAQGIKAGCIQIVTMRKDDYPDLVTMPDSSVVKVWTSFADVRAYFGWKDKAAVGKLLAIQ